MESKSSGLGCLDVFIIVLVAIFTAAKLIGLVDWSWWVVFTPILGYIVLFIIMLILSLLGSD